jgi:hypothetical protein
MFVLTERSSLPIDVNPFYYLDKGSKFKLNKFSKNDIVEPIKFNRLVSSIVAQMMCQPKKRSTY